MSGQLFDMVATKNPTSGGSSETGNERSHRQALRPAVHHPGDDRDARRHVCHHLAEVLRVEVCHRGYTPATLWISRIPAAARTRPITS